MTKNQNTKQITTLSLLLTISILLNYVENLIQLPISIPGIKLGLANSLNLVVLYFYGIKKYILIGFLRILIVGILFTGLFSNNFCLSLSGFCFSSLIVIIIRLTNKGSIFSLSINSSLFHSIGQIIMAMIIFATEDNSSIYLLSYLPLLTITGIITGSLIAYISSLIILKIKKAKLI